MADYSTYVVGCEAFFNQATLDEYKDWLGWSSTYISNWRILHIDGFEGFYPRHVHFEWAQEVGERTFDGTHEWINVGKVKPC